MHVLLSDHQHLYNLSASARRCADTAWVLCWVHCAELSFNIRYTYLSGSPQPAIALLQKHGSCKRGDVYLACRCLQNHQHLSWCPSRACWPHPALISAAASGSAACHPPLSVWSPATHSDLPPPESMHTACVRSPKHRRRTPVGLVITIIRRRSCRESQMPIEVTVHHRQWVQGKAGLTCDSPPLSHSLRATVGLYLCGRICICTLPALVREHGARAAWLWHSRHARLDAVRHVCTIHGSNRL